MAVSTITLESANGDTVVVSAAHERWKADYLDDDIVLDVDPQGMYDTGFTVRTQSGAFETGGRIVGVDVPIREPILPFWLTKESRPRFQKLWGTPGNFHKVKCTWASDNASQPRSLILKLAKEIVYTTEDGFDADVDGVYHAVVSALAVNPMYESPAYVLQWTNPSSGEHTGWFNVWNPTDQPLWLEWTFDPATEWQFPDWSFGQERKWGRPTDADIDRMIVTPELEQLLSVMSDPFMDTYVSADLSNAAGLFNGVEPLYMVPPYTGTEDDPIVMPVICDGPAGGAGDVVAEALLVGRVGPRAVTATFAEPYLGSDHVDFGAWARELREYRISRAYDRPNIRLYDGDYIYRGTVYGEIGGNCSPIVNETGTIQLRLPIDLDDRRRTWAAFWALDEEARGTSNIHIIVETMGARIGGRMKGKHGVTVTRGPDGDEVVIDFLDDIEELKFVHTAGNPFLPVSLIQQPKAWMLLAQADHGILLTMLANLLRLQLTNINIETIFQLLNPANWNIPALTELFLSIWSQSQIVIKPRFFGDSVAPLALVVGSIRTSIFDVAAPIMEDAELQWEVERWLTGDPEPWPGAGTGWRNGTLFVGITDKSGFRTGTSIGGNLLTGLTRTFADVLSNHVEDSYDLITGETIDETGYRLPGFLGTLPAHPYVIYRDGDITGIQTSEFSRSPGGPGKITVGGQSMPGVNELISAAINYGGDVLGDNLSVVISAFAGINLTVGSLGGALDAFLQPIYKDSILAHMSVPLLLRTSRQGWGHYLETTSTNVTQAYTAASIMDLRARRRETDPDTAFTLTVANASPWLIGDNGFGHWWLGDRVGGTSKYLMPRVFVRRCRSLDIDWGQGKGITIEATFGDTRNDKDGLDRLTTLIANASSGLQQIGLA